MKVCLIGHFADTRDEGVRNVGKSLARELEKTSLDVSTLNMSSFSTLKEIFLKRPDIIHFVLSPTGKGIITAKLMSLLSPGSKTIISAVQPAVPQRAIYKFARPGMVLVQSKDSERLFQSFGYKTGFLTNGVDINKFQPVDDQKKRELRIKYGLPADKFVILHLASIKEGRNLGIFKDLQKDPGNICLIIGRENDHSDEGIINSLNQSGCQVWIKHFSNIEEIYSLSDCYLFPTVEKTACIETPLSVLEAMACNLPVITTKFGSLPEMFAQRDGLFFVNGDEDYYRFIDAIKNNGVNVRTRDLIASYSSEEITKKMVMIYEELLNGRRVSK
ncbi:MAG: glycosyltransferase [Dehalobacter sp.]|nr:glycosyltransferase [Dehalobacter sp.]